MSSFHAYCSHGSSSGSNLLLLQFLLASSPRVWLQPWPCAYQTFYSSQPIRRAALPQLRRSGLPVECESKERKPFHPHSPQARFRANSPQQPGFWEMKTKAAFCSSVLTDAHICFICSVCKWNRIWKPGMEISVFTLLILKSKFSFIIKLLHKNRKGQSAL